MAPQQVLQWDDWQPGTAPTGLRLADFFPVNIIPESTAAGGGPYLHSVYLEAFGTAITAHRKTNDEHIRFVGERRADCCAYSSVTKLP